MHNSNDKNINNSENQTNNTLDYSENRKYEALVFLIFFFGLFGTLSWQMGAVNMINTIMRTAHDLLMNTVFFIMGITVISGALGKLLIEFGVVRLLEKILSPVMRPLFNLPGVASLGALMTFFSDNPAIISLARDKKFASYFKKRELISLCNFGTAFGMGLIVMAFMFGHGFFTATFAGLVGAIFGAIVSTRIMQHLISDDEIIPMETTLNPDKADKESIDERKVAVRKKVVLKKGKKTIVTNFKQHEDEVFLRFLNAILDGGKQGVDLGLTIIPGVLIISTFVMLITFGVKNPEIGYQGLAYEGVPVLPAIASWFSPIFKFLFGFKNPELIAFPITSLGAVGAALSLIKIFIAKGILGANEIAVFTAMGMCWSGYLSTHTAMLDALNQRHLTSRALLSHTIGGLSAGIFAHFLLLIIS